MKINHKLNTALIILMHFCISSIGFASVKVPKVHTVAPLHENVFEYSNQDHHALEVPVFQIISGSSSHFLNASKESKPQFEIVFGSLNINRLTNFSTLSLYYKLSSFIIPGLGIDKLLFPFHSHT